MMRVLYYVGDKIGLETIVSKGELITEQNNKMYIQTENSVIKLENIKYVEFKKLNGLGSIIKITFKDNIIIFITVPRIYFNIGTGFAIINYFKTKKLYKQLMNS